MGLLLNYVGVSIAIISQRRTKKKGKIKFALLGLGVYFILYFSYLAIIDELPFDMGEIFIFG